jgi:1-acyl-sn-glycerol-3-phosphate acyltransferase
VIRKAKVPVIPTVIDGSFRAWPKGQALPHRRPVRVLIGKPIRMDHMDGKEIVAEIDRMLRAMLAELRAKEAASRSRV